MPPPPRCSPEEEERREEEEEQQEGGVVSFSISSFASHRSHFCVDDDASDGQESESFWIHFVASLTFESREELHAAAHLLHSDVSHQVNMTNVETQQAATMSGQRQQSGVAQLQKKSEAQQKRKQTQRDELFGSCIVATVLASHARMFDFPLFASYICAFGDAEHLQLDASFGKCIHGRVGEAREPTQVESLQRVTVRGEGE